MQLLQGRHKLNNQERQLSTVEAAHNNHEWLRNIVDKLRGRNPIMEVLGDDHVDLRHWDAYHCHECNHSLLRKMVRSGAALLKAYRLHELVMLF